MNKQFIVRGDIPKEPALIIKNQPILTPGEYYGISLTENDIQEYLNLTDWNNPYNTALIYGHKTNTSSRWVGNPSPEDWVGNYTKPVWKNDVPKPGIYSDINIYDSNFAAKLAYGKVRCGVSIALDLQNKTVRNLSVIDNPKCKDAFLNLSDESNVISLSDPIFLNLSENINTDERGLTDKDRMNIEEKLKVLEKENKELSEKVKELESKKVVEPKEKDVPKEDPKPKVEDKPKEDPEPVIEPKPKIESDELKAKAKSEPVILEKTTDSKEVVEAINKLGDKFSDEFKKAAVPQSVAPTDPNAKNDSMDDEVTNDLVEQYSKLHPDNSIK